MTVDLDRLSSRLRRLSETNPVSTKMVRPGRLEYHFSPGVTAESLVDDLAASRWWGEVVGPHGSGKSTLLHSLIPRIECRDRHVQRVTLHRGQRRLRLHRKDVARWNSRTQVVVDGYEQLWTPSRVWLNYTCRRRGVGLLISVHRSAGLPLLWRTKTSPELVRRVVAELLGERAAMIEPGDIKAAWERHGPNLREVLFDLYDDYEIRRKTK